MEEEIILTKENFPSVYAWKLKELMKLGKTKEEAEEYLNNNPIKLSILCIDDDGVLGIELSYLEGSIVPFYSPYTGKQHHYWN